MSANSESGLAQSRAHLAEALKRSPHLDLGDLAYTLQLGRDHKLHRWMTVCTGREEAIAILEGAETEKARQGVAPKYSPPVFFLFPGQGSEFVQMGFELYTSQAAFRRTVDQCCEWVQPVLDLDLRDVFYPAPERSQWAAEQLQRLGVMQPALFVIEYALSQLLMEWGLHPGTALGHSVGEYVAAAVSGVMTPQDAATLVCIRGRLLEEAAAPGGMLAVALSESEIEKWLRPGITLAAINAPDQCVLSGPVEPLAELAGHLAENGIYCRHLAVSRAGHSPMMESVLQEFARAAAKVPFHPIDQQYLSSVSGGWLQGDQVANADYWVRQLREPVRFAAALEALLKESNRALLVEVGPGQALSSVARLVRRNLRLRETVTVASAMRPFAEDKGTYDFLLQSAGKLWLAGALFDWKMFYRDENRQLLPLPAWEQSALALEENPPEEIAAAKPSRPFHAAPRTATESLIYSEWRQLFHEEDFGIHDNFFELGGNSLTVMRLLARIRNSICEISPRTVFEYPTIAQLAQLIDCRPGIDLQRSVARPAISDMVPLPKKPECVPVSHAQQRLWFIEQLEGPSAEYNAPDALRIKGDLNLLAMQEALSALVARHEVLRTHFAEVDGRPIQIIEPAALVGLPLEDFSAMDAETQNARLACVLEDEWKPVFDLSRGPVCRFRVLKMGERDHVLVRNFHHIAVDGWSLSIFNRELAALYQAFDEGQSAQLPPLPLQYADFAIWQHNTSNTEAFLTSFKYWKRQLAGIPDRLELPKDRARAGQRAIAARMHRAMIDGEQLARLKMLARETNTTLYMVLLAGFAVLLGRYSGQDDVAIATPLANRHDPRLEQLIGLFINSLVMRVRMAPGMSFVELLSAVKTTCLEAYEHQDLPFERIVEELLLHRTLNAAVLFQVLFAFQNTPRDTLRLSKLAVEPLEIQRRTVSADIELHAAELDQCLQFQWAYCLELFDSWRIEQMSDHYLALLASAIGAPDTPLYRMNLLKDQESQQLLGLLDNTKEEVFHDTVCNSFEAQVQRTPGDLAVVCGSVSITYEELNQQSNRLAHHLISNAIGPEIIVGVCLERSVELVVALLAVLKSGGTYLPLAPEQPRLRLEQILATASPVLVISTTALSDRIPAGQPPLLLDAALTRETLARLPGSDPTDEHRRGLLLPHYAAYVIFTSGSTGHPKGVVVSHDALANKIAGYNRKIAVRSSSRYAAMSSLSFDPLLLEILCPLLGGGVCVMVPDSVREDAEEFGEFVRQHAISVIDATPGQIEALFPEGRLPVRLQTLFVGGDVFSPRLANLLQMQLAAEQVLNLYGPAEVTIDATGYRIPPSGVPDGCVPIGKPLLNYRVYVLGKVFEVAPVGVTGELYIGGRGLARGYLGRPALTAERFIADPFGPPGSRLYRTGDLARLNREGMLEFVGRADRQIKIRGIRIEPAEIEAVLAAHPTVRNAAVLLRSEAAERRELVGYIVPEGAGRPDLAALFQYLRERLPEYMVPSALLMVGSIPLTPNGKLDWQALPLPSRTSVTGGAPRSPIQELLCNIFAELLGLDQVGIEDNFFALGGHSLLATRLVSRLRAALKTTISVRTLFERPTVAELALCLERPARDIPLVPRERPAELPLSFAQERFWVINQLEGTSAHYNIPEAVHLRGKFDLQAFINAVRTMAARHEILRTHFDHVEGKPIQVIQPAISFDLAEEDITHLDEPAQRKQVEEALRREWEVPFDLALAPLFRMRLFKLSADHHILVRTFHHIIFDAWSQGILNSESAAFYKAYSGGAQSHTAEDILQPLPVQYVDFALWQRQRFNQRTRALQLDYWQEQLHAIPAELDLPKDRPRPPRQTFAADTCRFGLSGFHTAALKQLSRENHATLYMTVLSTLALLLSRYSGQTDISIGSPIANRSDTNVECLIGPFINSLVMRVQVNAAGSFPALLRSVRSVALDAYQHQDIPFEQLVEAFAPRRELNRTPFFQVMLAFQDASTSLKLDGLEIEKMRNDEVPAHFDLEIHVEECESQLQFFWIYNRDLFDRWRMKQMARHFENLLSVAPGAGARVGELEMLSAPERRQVLEDWNSTGQHFGIWRPVHFLFEQQAESAPARIAVEYCGQNLAYAELNRRANQWAHRLRSLGVQSEDIVGIAMERSLEMVVAVLAVLKAGAAYLPLPAEYPSTLLDKMLDDARPRILLVQSGVKEKFDPWPVTTLCLDEYPEMIPESGVNTGIQDHPLSAAYLIYTSGSTGKPKGVMNTHVGLRNRLLWMQRMYQLRPDDVVVQKTPFGFDVSVWEFLWPLIVGAKLVMARPGGHQDPDYLVQLIERYAVTTMHFVPSMLKAFLQTGNLEKCRSLRRVICSGEALSPELATECLQRIPADLHNLYGPTEAAIDVTFWKCSGKDIDKTGVAIGAPIANMQAYVLDRQLQPLPPGITGELYVAGVGLARGYLGQPELTAERFLPNPFNASHCSRMYRTGDLARWRNDGNLEYLGRTDLQVKIRGCRVELGEIEASLREYRAVADAAALVHEDKDGDKKIVAYVVRNSQAGALDVRDLFVHLKSRLPAYSVPAQLVELSSLPLSANGKVDRKALPKPESLGSGEAAFTPPRSATERAIAAIWKEKLGLKDVSIFDNFFDSGGHSLKAIQVYAALRKLTSKPVKLTDIFKYPTIALLAEFLTSEAEPHPATEKDGTEKLKQYQTDREERLSRRLAARPPEA